MGTARVEVRYETVLKDYKDTDRERYYKEIRAYESMPWATPALRWHGEFWIEIERLTPILELGRERSSKYREPLRDLLKRVHLA